MWDWPAAATAVVRSRKNASAGLSISLFYIARLLFRSRLAVFRAFHYAIVFLDRGTFDANAKL